MHIAMTIILIVGLYGSKLQSIFLNAFFVAIRFENDGN